MCYIGEEPYTRGSCALFGFMHIFQDHRDRMPTAVRALRAWSKLHSFGEGAGIPREAVAMIG
eukprot:2232126-Heterocapsa_arctica.AAC.1